MIEYPKKPDTVYYFGTCLVDLIYPQAGMAGIRLIQREGVDVIFPQSRHAADNRHLMQATSMKHV